MSDRTRWGFLFVMSTCLLFFFAMSCGGGDDDDDNDSDVTDDDSSDDDDDDDDSGDDDTHATDCVDEDGDGFGQNCDEGDDCDDSNDAVHAVLIGYSDEDLDGFPGTAVEFCASALPSPYADSGDDCDDNDPLTYPGAVELPDDGVDQDCVGGDANAANDDGIFVDGVSGSDSNSGTKEEPVKTVQEGVDLIKGSKHQVYIAAGTYTESVSIAKKYIELFGGYDASDWSRDIDAHETTIEGAGNPAVTIQKDAEETRLDGLTLDGPEASVSTAVSVATNEVVDVLRCRIRTFATKNTATGIMSDFAPTLRVLESQIVADENGGDINGIDLTDEAEGGSLVVNGLEVTATLKGNDTFHGIRIEGMDSASIARTSVTVSDTTTGFLTGILGISTPMEVRASTIDLAGSGSVRGIFSQSAKLESIDNVIRVTGYIFGLGIAVNSADGVVSGNGIEATGEALSTGIVLDGTTEDQFVLLNNIVHAAPSGSSGNNFTLRVSDMKGIASNNVFVAGEGINVFAARLEPSHDPSNKPGDVTLFNNIFISEQASSEGAPLQVYANPGGATPVIVLRNNDLIGDQPDCFMDTQVGSGCVETLADLNECNWPYCDDASDNIDDGPMFVDSDNGDYHLSSDSPLIDAGLDVTATLPSDLLDFALYDFENDPRPMGDGWDIGADEYHP